MKIPCEAVADLPGVGVRGGGPPLLRRFSPGGEALIMIRAGLIAAVALLFMPVMTMAALPDLTSTDREQLMIYARDTWRSLEAATSPVGLPSDGLRHSADGWKTTDYTSPTNIAAYLWSILAAEDLHLISPEESRRRLDQTLTAVSRLERAHGFFFNWYNSRTGERLVKWPGGGKTIRPFLSTVDNGWLAAALIMVSNGRPELRALADGLLGPMNFGFFYNAETGLLRGGFFTDDQSFAGFDYGMLNTEPRIASYIGIARGDLPAEHYFRMHRGDLCHPADAVTDRRKYQGVEVSEGNRSYRGLRIVPSWDGTMFEALMVTLFVPESGWAAGSWGRNHPLYVRAQMEHGLHDAQLGYWGQSASSDPDGGYHAFGVAELGSGACIRPTIGRREGVITPHASFLALSYAPAEALENLRKLQHAFPIYSSYGFYDAVDVSDGHVSDEILTLDQGMILAAIGNAFNDVLQRLFCQGTMGPKIQALIGQEVFEVGEEPLVRAALATSERH